MIAALTLCVAIFAVNWGALDAAQSMISGELPLTTVTLMMVIWAYPLALLAVLIPVRGRLSVLLYGLTAFGLTSAVGAVAVGGGMLIACRLGQGLAAAIVLRAGFELTRTHFRGTTWWPALVAPAVVALLGQLAGPVIGGAVTWYFGFRFVLLLGMPLAFIAVLAVALCTPRTHPAPNHP